MVEDQIIAIETCEDFSRENLEELFFESLTLLNTPLQEYGYIQAKDVESRFLQVDFSSSFDTKWSKYSNIRFNSNNKIVAFNYNDKESSLSITDLMLSINFLVFCKDLQIRTWFLHGLFCFDILPNIREFEAELFILVLLQKMGLSEAEIKARW